MPEEIDDIQAIMNQVAENVRQKKEAGVYRDEDVALPVAFARFLPLDDTNRLGVLKAISRLELEGEPITSHRRLVGPILKFVKRVNRLVVRKYTDSVFLRQNQVNAGLVAAIEDLQGQITKLQQEIAELKGRKGGE